MTLRDRFVVPLLALALCAQLEGAPTPYFVPIQSQGDGVVVSDPTIRPIHTTDSGGTGIALIQLFEPPEP